MMKLLKKQDLLPNMVIGLQKRVLTEPYPEHMHNYFEIEYILNGSGICLIDGVEYDIRPGALFFMTPANIQTIRTDHAELINLMFSSDPNEEGALARLLLSHTDPAFFWRERTRNLPTGCWRKCPLSSTPRKCRNPF